MQEVFKVELTHLSWAEVNEYNVPSASESLTLATDSIAILLGEQIIMTCMAPLSLWAHPGCPFEDGLSNFNTNSCHYIFRLVSAASVWLPFVVTCVQKLVTVYTWVLIANRIFYSTIRQEIKL